MAEVDRLLVRIEAETAQLRRELERAAKTTEAMQRRMEGSSSSAQRSLDRLNRVNFGTLERSMSGLQSTAATLRNTLGALGLAFSAREFIGAIDTYNNMQAQLRLVVGEGEALTRVQNDLYALSQRTATDLEANVQLYARISRATQTLNMDYGDQLRMVEAIAQAARISGASQQEASAAVLQFSQGLAAGALRGEELNSILEQMPRLAQALADGLGVPIGALRELGSEGELTAERVAEALLSQADTLETEFSRVEKTVGNAWTQLENAVLSAIGVMDEGSGSTKELTNAIDQLRIIAEDPNFAAGLQAIGNAIAYIARQAAEAIADVGAFMRAMDNFDFQGMLSALGDRTGPGFLYNQYKKWTGDDEGVAPGDGEPLRLEITKPVPGVQPAPRARLAPRAAPAPRSAGRAAAPEIIDLRPRWDTKKPPIPLPRGMTREQMESEQRATEAARKAMDEYDAQMRQLGETIRQSVMTPAEELDARLTELNEALAAGAISQETFGRAATQAWDEFGQASATAVEQVEGASDAANDLGMTFSSAFEDAIVNGAKLSEVLRGIEQDLIRIAARKLVTEPLANSIGGLFGGQQGVPWRNPDTGQVVATGGGGIGGIFAKLFHSGGRVGDPATSRLVSSALFNGAQRLHSGGVAGLRGGEVPAILQKGEVVLPRGAGSVPQVVVNVVNNGGAQVDVQTSNGGRSIDIIIDEMVAGAVRSGGRTTQALRQMGVRPSTVAR